MFDMKRLLILAFSVGMWGNARAEYTPFVVEGKTWVLESFLPVSTNVMRRECVLRGDTVIGGTLYKRLFSDGYYEGAYREEGRRVYAVWNGTTEEQLLYDFGLKKGDAFSRYEVCMDDFINNHGRTLHRIGIGFPETAGDADDGVNVWLEGVGSAWGPQSSIYFTMTGTGERIRYCGTPEGCLYKDSLQEFVSPGLAWADGYTVNGAICLNFHRAKDTRIVGGRTYTVMQANRYVTSAEGDVSENESVEYLLREDADGETWLRMDSPRQMAGLYGLGWDEKTIASLTDCDLYLFNTRADGWNFMTYGHLDGSAESAGSWQVEKAKVKQNSNTRIVLENGNYSFLRSLSGGGTLQFLMSVGWMKYGPFYGLGEPDGDGKRFFSILYDGDDVVFHDEECMESLRTDAPSLAGVLNLMHDRQTGLPAIGSDEWRSDGEQTVVFDLEGRRVKNRKTHGNRHIYIENGRKYVGR